MKLVVLLVLSVLILALSNLRIFNLKKIDCQLDNYPCPLTLEPVLVGLSGKNIFKLNRLQVIRELSQLDQTLTDIQVTKKIPNELLIKISRRQPLAQLAFFNNLDFIGLDSTQSATLSGEMSGKFQLIDQQGQVYEANNINLESLPVVAVSGQFNSDQIVKTLLVLNNHYVSYNLLAWLNNKTIIIKTNLGPYAVVDPTTGVDSSIGSLQYILTGLKIGDRLPTKIDLRFDKPVLTY
ncbi:MAG: hypothetical protein NTZ93_05005 [Candidatus Beckwithbacteria bacterium]|nr:hypothetical protein [Candidatus Beckwithbacteria bacterium]